MVVNGIFTPSSNSMEQKPDFECDAYRFFGTMKDGKPYEGKVVFTKNEANVQSFEGVVEQIDGFFVTGQGKLYRNYKTLQGKLENSKILSGSKECHICTETGNFDDQEQLTGEGVRTNLNNHSQKGVFESGVFKRGSFQYKNCTAEGVFNEEGLPEGQTVITFEDGAKFEGLVNNGVKVSGTYTFRNGDVYTGSYKNGIKNDDKCVYIIKGERYEGSIIDDGMAGEGTYLGVKAVWREGKLVYTK